MQRKTDTFHPRTACRKGFALILTLSVLAVISALSAVLVSYLDTARKESGFSKAMIQGDLYYSDIRKVFKGFKEKKALYSMLYLSPFGESSYFDGMLRFNLENDPQSKQALEKIMQKYCKSFALITLRDLAQGNRLDYAYQVKLKRNVRQDDFVGELHKIPSIQGINFMMQEATVEL